MSIILEVMNDIMIKKNIARDKILIIKSPSSLSEFYSIQRLDDK